MAFDFQCVFPQESIRLSQILLTPSNSVGLPRALDIVGEDFRSVDEVTINESESPDVIVLSKTRLIAQLPDELQNTLDIRSVSVLSRRLTVTDRSLIRFRIGDRPGVVRGIFRLLQLFMKILFQTPGSDIWNRKSGGGGLKNVGETFSSEEGADIISDFVISVSNTSRQIVATQGREPRIPRDERLLTAKVLRVTYDRNIGALLATVEVTSQAGRAATANLEL
jgi:hypothetical protein